MHSKKHSPAAAPAPKGRAAAPAAAKRAPAFAKSAPAFAAGGKVAGKHPKTPC